MNNILQNTKTVVASANAAQGLTCFHQYMDRDLKTLSIDMLYSCLDAFETTTRICIPDSEESNISIRGIPDHDKHFSYIREITDAPLSIETSNNFDADVGLASSSSGYACLAGGLARILSLPEDPRSLSMLARRGSFSASASIAGGICLVRQMERGVPTFAEQVFAPEDMRDLTVIVAFSEYNKANHDFYA